MPRLHFLTQLRSHRQLRNHTCCKDPSPYKYQYSEPCRQFSCPSNVLPPPILYTGTPRDLLPPPPLHSSSQKMTHRGHSKRRDSTLPRSLGSELSFLTVSLVVAAAWSRSSFDAISSGVRRTNARAVILLHDSAVQLVIRDGVIRVSNMSIQSPTQTAVAPVLKDFCTLVAH